MSRVEVLESMSTKFGKVHLGFICVKTSSSGATSDILVSTDILYSRPVGRIS